MKIDLIAGERMGWRLKKEGQGSCLDGRGHIQVREARAGRAWAAGRWGRSR